jgi:hypothetical protein
MKTIRVEANNSSAKGQELNFFVVTGSQQEPVISPSDNNGFPAIRDFYGRCLRYQGQDGVHVTVRFDSNAVGNAIAMNIFQPGMTNQPHTVIPLP